MSRNIILTINLAKTLENKNVLINEKNYECLVICFTR